MILLEIILGLLFALILAILIGILGVIIWVAKFALVNIVYIALVCFAIWILIRTFFGPGGFFDMISKM